ncbi:MAG: hypothetical protein RI922_2472 [Bacteroidota bacterium]|jgi:hypothetical protein
MLFIMSKFHLTKFNIVRNISTALFTIILFSAYSQESTVAPKYSNEFLAIGVGADALGLGNAMVAQTNDVNSGYWNPAGLTGANKWLDISLMHSPFFSGISKYDYLGLSHAIDDKSTVGFSIIRFAVDDIPNTTQLIDNNGNINYDNITTFTAADNAFLFTYARKLKVEGLSVGGNFKLIHRKVGDFAKSWGFGLDGGVQYKIKDKWRFGVMARDITSTFNAWVFNLDQQMQEVFVSTGNELPKNGLELTLPRIILAAHGKFELGKGIYAASEIDLDVTTDGKRNVLIKSGVLSVDPHAGVEFGFKKYVAVRFGVSNLQYIKQFDDSQKLSLQPNVGIGLAFKNFKLDYALTNFGNSSNLYSHVVSLKVSLDRPKNMK